MTLPQFWTERSGVASVTCGLVLGIAYPSRKQRLTRNFSAAACLNPLNDSVKFRERASETVLVHGASGGVGIAAVQIARSMGLMILGTAGTPTGLEIAKREGRTKFSITVKPDIRKKF